MRDEETLCPSFGDLPHRMCFRFKMAGKPNRPLGKHLPRDALPPQGGLVLETRGIGDRLASPCPPRLGEYANMDALPSPGVRTVGRDPRLF